MNDDVFKVWLAGFFDGEGCFYLRAQSTSVLEHPGATISQKDQPLLMEEIRARYGGSVQLQSTGVYNWYTTSIEDLKAFIRDILPYLRIKKEKAEVILAICNLTGGEDDRSKILRIKLQEAYHEKWPKIRRTKDEV